MILKETILSAFTERGTLLKWLKKVEAALNNAVLTDISVEQISATQVKLKFTFENGDFVESPVLTLPRGEKGDPGKDGAPGKDGLDGEGIAATIEVGTVTTGAAGTNASVTNVGTEQHAVLNFVIPRGDTGASGAEGSAGVGFDDADFISMNDGTINITADDNGVNIEAPFEVAVGEEVLEIPASMYLPLKGSESIVIDVDESGDFIDIHLDADIAAKLGRVLVTPMSAPASVSLVAVDTSNTQTLLTLGNGLSVSGGVLSASGGGGSGAKDSSSLEAVWQLKPTFDFSGIAGNITINVGLLTYAGYYTSIEIDADNQSITVNNVSHGNRTIYQNGAWVNNNYSRWALTHVENNIDVFTSLLNSNLQSKEVDLKGGFAFKIAGTYGYSFLKLTFANGAILENTVNFNFTDGQVFHHVVALKCTIAENQAFSISSPVIEKIGTGNWEYSDMGGTYQAGEYMAVILNDASIDSFDD